LDFPALPASPTVSESSEDRAEVIRPYMGSSAAKNDNAVIPRRRSLVSVDRLPSAAGGSSRATSRGCFPGTLLLTGLAATDEVLAMVMEDRARGGGGGWREMALRLGRRRRVGMKLRGGVLLALGKGGNGRR